MDKLEELRLRYLHSLPQKAADVRAQWQRLRDRPDERALLVELHQQVHRLSGSAPAYGFEAIGALARPIDQRLAEWLRNDDPEIRIAATALVAALAGPVDALVDALDRAGESELPPG
ncbi:Hpt domain-containing protein [Tahibacter caeni]|uniref:Hpt domain-containing protein n=1 Tax=Tahibacter caeni TaxID=1453545 RepID=UPI002147E46C|nr:Hpt domain-containing protein [Tahibacter caeni]